MSVVEPPPENTLLPYLHAGLLQVIDRPVQIAGVVAGTGGFIGGGALTRALRAPSVVPSVWGAIAGGLVGVGGWLYWRQCGRLRTRAWRIDEHDQDVPYDLATITLLHAQLNRAARWLGDPAYSTELHRWDLLDPAEVPRTRGNLDRLAESIAHLLGSAHEAGERASGRQEEILAELHDAYAVDTVPGDDGAADELIARTAVLRDLHGLDHRNDV